MKHAKFNSFLGRTLSYSLDYASELNSSMEIIEKHMNDRGFKGCALLQPFRGTTKKSSRTYPPLVKFILLDHKKYQVLNAKGEYKTEKAVGIQHLVKNIKDGKEIIKILE